DGVDKRFDGVDKRFDGVDKRFDGVDKRFDGVDKRFTILENKVDAHSADIIEGQQKYSAALDAVAGVLQQVLVVKDLEERVTTVEQDQTAMKTAIKYLKFESP